MSNERPDRFDTGGRGPGGDPVDLPGDLDRGDVTDRSAPIGAPPGSGYGNGPQGYGDDGRSAGSGAAGSRTDATASYADRTAAGYGEQSSGGYADRPAGARAVSDLDDGGGDYGRSRVQYEPATTAAAPSRRATMVEDRYERISDDRVDVVERPRADRVRWGPIWAGLVTALATFLLLQLALFATDAISLDINPTASQNAIPLWTGLAAIVAFLLGGIVAGASTRWSRADDGLLQGIVMWALAIVALVVLSIVGASALTSGVGNVLDRFDAINNAVSDVNAGNVDTNAAIDQARDSAAAAALFLGITFVASALGALIGSRMWPRHGKMDATEARRRDLAVQ